MFLPNSQSFLLVKTKNSKPAIQSGIFGVYSVRDRSPHSGRSRAFGGAVSNGIQESTPTPDASVGTSVQPLSLSEVSGRPTIVDKDKRTFLKAAGIAGASIIASLFLPEKADALIMGSAPTTGVVGVKNSTNARINPATEETVSSLLKPTDLTFADGDLQVKVTSLPATGSSSFSDSGNPAVDKKGLVDADRHVQVDVLSSALPTTASTETTLQTISFGGKKWALRLATDSVNSEIDYVGEADIGTLPTATSWRIKRIDSTTGIIIMWAGTTVYNAGGLAYAWSARETLNYF